MGAVASCIRRATVSGVLAQKKHICEEVGNINAFFKHDPTR